MEYRNRQVFRKSRATNFGKAQQGLPIFLGHHRCILHRKRGLPRTHLRLLQVFYAPQKLVLRPPAISEFRLL